MNIQNDIQVSRRNKTFTKRFMYVMEISKLKYQPKVVMKKNELIMYSVSPKNIAGYLRHHIFFIKHENNVIKMQLMKRLTRKDV